MKFLSFEQLVNFSGPEKGMIYLTPIIKLTFLALIFLCQYASEQSGYRQVLQYSLLLQKEDLHAFQDLTSTIN